MKSVLLLFSTSHCLPLLLELGTEDEVGKQSTVEIGNKVPNQSTIDTVVLFLSLEHTTPHSITGVCGGEDESEVDMNMLTERSELLPRESSGEGRRRASRKCQCCKIT